MKTKNYLEKEKEYSHLKKYAYEPGEADKYFGGLNAYIKMRKKYSKAELMDAFFDYCDDNIN